MPPSGLKTNHKGHSALFTYSIKSVAFYYYIINGKVSFNDDIDELVCRANRGI